MKEPSQRLHHITNVLGSLLLFFACMLLQKIDKAAWWCIYIMVVADPEIHLLAVSKILPILEQILQVVKDCHIGNRCHRIVATYYHQ